MKKITLMIFVSLMSFFAYAQLPEEHFDDPWTGTPAAPPLWTVINQFGPNVTWAQTIPGNLQQPPFGGDGHSAYLQKENVSNSSAIPSDWLVTKPFPMIANAELKFQSRLTIGDDQGGVYKIYIMPATNAPTYENFTDPTKGTVLVTYSELTLNPQQTVWTEKTVTIPANANWAPETDVYIAFVMEGDDKDRWFLDNVKVAALCAPPTTPTVTATTVDSATFTWNNTGATSWEIEVVPDQDSPTGIGEVYNGTLPYVKTGLTACTNYKFYVRNLCSDGGVSAWAGPIFFKARCVGETCATPLVIPPGNQSVTGNTANYGDFYEGISGTGCNSTGNYLAGNDVVYTYTPTDTGTYNVSLTGTGGAAGMFIYSSCANIGVACLGGGVASASVPVNLPAFSMTADTTYYIVISSNGTPQTTPYTLSIQQVFCPQPTAGTATGITGTTAILGWTAGTVGAASWEIAVQNSGSGLPASGTTVTSNSYPAGATTAGVPFTPATSYEFYVREACAGGTFSIWAGPFLFTTTQVPAGLNYAQNFDGGAHGFTLANGTQINKWTVGSATSNSPSNSLYITNDGTANAFNITSTSVVHAYRDIQMPATIGQLALSFDWKGFGESCCDYFRVWVVPATFTPATGNQIGAAADRRQIGGNFNLGGAWASYTTVFDALAAWNGQTVRLVFEWRNDGSVGTQPPAAIDNINLSLVTCPQPTALAVTSLTPTEGVVSWTAPAIVPPSYDVFVANTATPVPTATTVPTQNVTGTTATITPLTPDTFYYVWVRAHCGPTDQSFWTGPVRFSTPQVPDVMDYTQNFDGGAHNFTLLNDTQPNKWVVGTAVSNSPTNSLYITNDNGVTNAYDGALASVVHAYRDITIPATVPSGQALLQFDWRCLANSGDYFRVWVVPVTFTPTPGTQITAAASGGVQTGGNFTGSAAWTTANNVVTIPTAWNNTPRRIIFEWFNNAFTVNQPPAAIDNINFKVITCPAPTALTLGALTTTSATVSWTPPTAVPASYDYYYSTGATPPTEGTTPSGNVPGPTATISGLTDSTNYNVWVRSNCGGPAGTSFWIGPLNFNTPQIPAPMPYAQNFDGTDNPGYALNNGTQPNKWVIGAATFNSAARSLYVSNDNGVTNNYNDAAQSTVHAYRDIAMPAAIPTNQVLLQFDWKSLGESCCDYVKVWIVPVTFSPTPGTMITAAADRILIPPGNLNNNNTWTTVNYVANATGWAGTSRRLVFEWRNDGSIGPSPGGAIDNVNMSVITCSAPSALVVASIDAANATFTWTASTPPAASYDYYLTTSPTAPTAGTLPTGNVTGTSLTLSGLPDSTNYYLWIRSNCGAVDGTSFWVGGLNFNTPQIPATLPYLQNFDGTDNPSFTYTSGTQANKWVVGTATFNSPANSLYISNDNGVTNNYTVNSGSTVHAYRDIVIPAGATTLDFSFDWKNVGEVNDYVRVWRVPLSYNPVAGTAITTVAGIREQVTTVNLFNSATWQNASFAVPVTAVANTTQRFVFEWVNNTFTGTSPAAAIDNIDIKLLTCPRPSDLNASQIGMTSATLEWTENGTATAWEVYVVETGAPIPGTGTAGTPAATNPFVYDIDLEPGTMYQYYVRSICGPDDVSRWTGPFAFNTNVCEVIDQCPVDFILTDSGNNGWQNNKMTVTQSGIPVVVLGPQLTTGGGPVTVTAMLCKGVPYEVFWDNTTGTSPFGVSPQEIGLQIVNPYNNQTVFQRIAGSPSTSQGTQLYTGLAYCADITCPQPSGLVSESVVNEPNTTELGWLPGGTETQWEIVVQNEGAGFPTAATTGIISVEDEPEYVLGGLVPEQLYEYYVRAVCSDTDKSFWTGPLKFSIFTPPACADVAVYDVDLTLIPPDTEYVLCPGEELCVDFDANYYQIGETTEYEVTSIPFALPFPTTGGTKMDITDDDRWAPRVDLPFEFCFYGQVYNAAQVSSNGAVTFNANNAAYSNSPWSYNTPIPNATFPIRNAIYGVYQDLDVRYKAEGAAAGFVSPFANPEINYQVIGNYPCRALVVNFNEVAQFSACGTDPAIGAQTSQVVIYEISNIIEVYVKDRVSCTTWNNGNGLIGLQNADGTQAITPPDRNTGNWSTQNEAWRFTPAGPSTAVFEWLKNDVFYSSDELINVCVQSDEPLTTMTARATYSLCNGETVVRDSDFTIRIESQIILAEDPADLTKCGNGEDVTFDLNEAVADVMPDLTGYVFTYYLTEADAQNDTNAITSTFVTTATTTIWVRIMREGYPCFITNSFEVIINNVPPAFDVTPDVSICEGASTTITVTPGEISEGVPEDLSNATYTWTLGGAPLPDTTSSITVTVGGEYAVTVNKGGCIATKTSTVTVVAIPVADDPADVTECGQYVLPELTAGNSYWTATGGTGTQLAAGEVITSTQTIFVYAAAVENTACNDENSFVVTINTIPVLEAIADVSVCDSYVLPALSGANENAGYFTGPAGTGTPLSAGDVISSSQLIYVYQETGTVPNCTGEVSFTVTITVSPVADAPEDVNACDSYVLPALSAGSSYWTATGGTGNQLAAGEVITTSQTIFVYAAAQDNAACNDENSFEVVVTSTPEFSYIDSCDGGVYYVEVIDVDGTFNIDTAIYEWTGPEGFTSSERKIAPDAIGEYVVTVTTAEGCFSVDSFDVTSTACEVPRGISPNGDGYNDEFDLTALGVKKLEIFNRYGQEVYSKNNYTKEWNGLDKSGNELPTGTYFYLVERTNGETRTGWVYINRQE